MPENFSSQTTILKKKKTLIVITFMLIDVISLFPSHIGQMFSSSKVRGSLPLPPPFFCSAQQHRGEESSTN